MARHHYSADSAFHLPYSLLRYVRSCMTGGCAVVPDVGPTAGGIFLPVIAATIS